MKLFNFIEGIIKLMLIFLLIIIILPIAIFDLFLLFIIKNDKLKGMEFITDLVFKIIDY